MTLLCPNCRRPLDPALRCSGGHRYAERDGVLALLEDGFAAELSAFLARFEPIRASQAKPLLDPAAYERLPFGQDHHEWRARCHDLAVIRRLLRGRPPRRGLDIGAWNGWLSHRLAQDGHDLTGIDYFADRHDGLGARRFYRAAWRAIQMDLLDLAVLDAPYDLIIINRCLQFMPDPLEYVRRARRLLAPGGRLVVIGVQCFRDPGAKARAVAAMQAEHRRRHGFELFLRPTRGYLDGADLRALRAAGLRFRAYPQLWAANLKALLNPRLPLHCYGLAAAPAPEETPGD
ncbi:MAG TPA: class I SAM-dependent methyltransferase [Herpetosiphonaceae bacterium]|nr:class I SAM-dependent methyltransferase [Herpetosiphonaceae bacterium]